MITVGVVAPHAVPGADVELYDMAGDQLSVRVARISTSRGGGDPEPPTSASGLRALTHPAMVDEAVARLAPETLDVLAYASTSSAYAIGPAAELDLVRRLRERWSIPVCSTPAAAVEALRCAGSQRLSLVHPPWFGPDRSAQGAAYFGEQGFTVVQAELAGVPDDPERVEPDHVVDWVSAHVARDVEAVFLGGNGFRAARAVPELERRLGCLVLESNQVLLWSALTQTGISLDIQDFGVLLHSVSPPAPSGPSNR
jgi:maleate isomerase